MRKLTYYVASTIDGFIATEDGSVDFFPVGGDHGPAITAQYPETLPTKVREALGIDKRNANFDTVLMGRKTHDFGVRTGTSSPYAHLRQFVVSTTMTESPDPAVELISADPLATVRELKRDKGLGIWLCGGGELAQALLPEIDQIFLKLYPIVLGRGRSLFGDGPKLPEPTRFRVITSQVFEDGVAFVKYARIR
ncbi:dihydrofolate reductase family protein [Nocardia cyriacigeorgica]|jgi:dihydrofolate reductase|uniref:RibD C-terminal domain n=1 Tax=Nocardia cyriacigeorgica TaxID=135487 RepID=A0A2L2JSN8_9NOCA|nr:dihydrofolate reductase family protein [Nocardia cyriacigeorgica]AVH22873.1 deaminase [Nocardia cyriacigeorgica]MBF6089564.1 dihydrofolate reductase family protein [Nocardia cyriacigeorgica]MBF6094475.1 dihydrofolate reductase family protein [Nocardia cyriacigeorgica]MBF6101871.1 dihydrofolate reductase family protein [Nocardia cyriacigeorgica]MBF6158723.1 dihydrofolate reductase family protein [Nocardia cyriacigeorgica]